MLRLGFALCGSFCTFAKALELMETIKKEYDILPIMSETAYSTSTRFGSCEEINSKIIDISGKEIIHTISGAEPLGPKKMVDAVLIAPCTGNTLGKLANGITDTAVTMAVKSCLRIGIPIVICVSTNDGLGASLANIAKLYNTKNIYFARIYQDDCINKPNSLVCRYETVEQTLKLALNKKQIQPLF